MDSHSTFNWVFPWLLLFKARKLPAGASYFSLHQFLILFIFLRILQLHWGKKHEQTVLYSLGIWPTTLPTDGYTDRVPEAVIITTDRSPEAPHEGLTT